MLGKSLYDLFKLVIFLHENFINFALNTKLLVMETPKNLNRKKQHIPMPAKPVNG